MSQPPYFAPVIFFDNLTEKFEFSILQILFISSRSIFSPERTGVLNEFIVDDKLDDFLPLDEDYNPDDNLDSRES